MLRSVPEAKILSCADIIDNKKIIIYRIRCEESVKQLLVSIYAILRKLVQKIGKKNQVR